MENPSLREQPREQKAPIMESRQDASILGWLEGSGRLMDRDTQERAKTVLEEEESEEINALMGGDDDADDDEE
ncbi:DUF3134 domain-containing protein [Acaryochloris marina]|uniref:DUF3134 domain-containing protein n=1 Tax=Acaryochloris marina (strain MBIC 11017) TaxID=329726 RepID=B0BZI6_ACAM1|nr:DUF3134 domain-containing protein [Acaryochloris marina]ABW30731.1 conserved hypothetical protein [Acaryochloris marina MBIC11017]BDM79509.1 hypothetical protein AM10699_23770 [Acaryochloris marina MBIC10699]